MLMNEILLSIDHFLVIVVIEWEILGTLVFFSFVALNLFIFGRVAMQPFSIQLCKFSSL